MPDPMTLLVIAIAILIFSVGCVAIVVSATHARPSGRRGIVDALCENCRAERRAPFVSLTQAGRCDVCGSDAVSRLAPREVRGQQ